MPLSKFLDQPSGLSELDAVVVPAQQLVRDLLPGEAIERLRGKWLGRPLHPNIVRAPLGFFLSSVVLDFVPGTGPAAPTLITLGLFASVPAAASGAAEFSELPREAGRAHLHAPVPTGEIHDLRRCIGCHQRRRHGDRAHDHLHCSSPCEVRSPP